MDSLNPSNDNDSRTTSPVTLVPLSRLRASRSNPRRVRPDRDAHRRLVASIRSQGLLAPLVVRPDPVPDGDGSAATPTYTVVAGNRRLAALRDAAKGSPDEVSVACVVLQAVPAGADDARAVALAENFAREPMHPLDEAEAFARIAHIDARGVHAVAAEFGVSAHYVRQRLALAGLSPTVKAAYRAGDIDIATAEVFAAVPPARQDEVWREAGGPPRHAGHARNLIDGGWVDAAHALFDVARLPDGAVTRDLFAERVLVERGAFMAAQAAALEAEREKLLADGWGEVVVARHADVRDRLWAMDTPEGSYDDATAARLAELEAERAALEERYEGVEEDPEEDGDESPHDPAGEAQSTELATASARLEELDEEERTLRTSGRRVYPPEVRAASTAFLLLDPDGRARTEYRTPRRRARPAGPGSGGAGGGAGGEGPVPPPDPASPSSDDLTERQRAAAFAHQAYAVRGALLGDDEGARLARKRLVALALHEKVRTEALSVRTEPNGSTLHADAGDGFASDVHLRLRATRAEMDPFLADYSLPEDDAYARLCALDECRLDALIDLLTAELVSAHPARRTRLVCRLAAELGADVRRDWTPDAAWLAGYRKSQLAHLTGLLRGPVAARWVDDRKKPELVATLAKLFADAAAGTLDDAPLAGRVNGWLPPELRPEPQGRTIAETPAEGDTGPSPGRSAA